MRAREAHLSPKLLPRRRLLRRIRLRLQHVRIRQRVLFLQNLRVNFLRQRGVFLLFILYSGDYL